MLSNVLTDDAEAPPIKSLYTHMLREFTNCEDPFQRQECIGYTTDEANTENVIESPWTTDTDNHRGSV